MKTKKYVCPLVCVFLTAVFLFMTIYSLWFGAKNTSDIIAITDGYTVSTHKSGTSVYHHSGLDDKGDIHKYYWLTDDSVPSRFAGYLSGITNPLYVWVVINLISVALMIYMLYSLISRWDTGWLRFFLVCLFPFVPAFFRTNIQLGAYTLSGVLLLAVIYVGAIREASVIKWYFAMTLCAIVVSFISEFTVVVYILPFAAYRDIKSNYNGGKAASHILLLLLASVVIHFMFLRAFVDYEELYSALTMRTDATLKDGLRSFFCLDTKEKIGIYLPIHLMAAVSLYGLFSVEKYVKKYIYPGVFLYVWTIFFAGNDSYIAGVIYPALFFAFSKTLIHAKYPRNIKRVSALVLCLIVAICVVCSLCISDKSHNRGRNISYYTQMYAELYDKYTDCESLVLAVDDERNLAMQMYAAYPRKTILSASDDDICKKIIGMYYPQYIVSNIELNYYEYENVFMEDNRFVYRLKRDFQ